jgi:hypothetical protein
MDSFSEIYDLTHKSLYNPENNLNRQCGPDGKAYIEFESAGNYDQVSVMTLLDTGKQGRVWQNDQLYSWRVSYNFRK